LNISGVRKITILSHGKCIFPQTLSFRYAVSRIYVILRVAPPPEGSGPDSEGLKTRSFTSFRTTEQGPSRCSGRQSTRGRYHFYVILRSDATKNLTLVFKTLNPGPSPPGMFPPLRSGCSVTAIALLRTTINLRPVPLLCHSEERCDDRGASPQGKNLTLVFKTLNPGPSPPGMFPPLPSRRQDPDPLQSLRTTLCRPCSSIPEASPVLY